RRRGPPGLAQGAGSHSAGMARALAGGLTVAALGLGVLVNLLVLRALDLPGSLPVGLIMLVSAYAAGVLPGAPGRPGIFELAVATPLMAHGLAAPASLAAALGLHLVLLATLVAGGVLALPLGAFGQPTRSAVAEPKATIG